MTMLKLILGLSSLASIASAAGIYGQICDPTPYYDTLTWQYNDACQSIYLFCDPSNSKCNYIGCTNTDYTKGWNTNVRPMPGRCGAGTFCPDNRSKCTPVVATNSICEMQRDDECQGSNSICLNGICNVKAVPLEGKCGNDTTQYVSYDAEGDAELQTIIRDNCTDGTYCVNSICISSKANGASCSQDRECVSNTCNPDGVCVTGPDVFHQIAAWLWGVLGASVFVFILIVLLLLWALQRYQSKKERAKIGKFFGDNEEFAKYAMLDHDNDNDDADGYYHDDTVGLQPPPSIGHRDSFDPANKQQRASMVYLTTPDYAKSSSLSLGHHGSSTKLPLNGGGGGGTASPRGSGTFTPPTRGSGTFTPPARASGSFPNLANNHP